MSRVQATTPDDLKAMMRVPQDRERRVLSLGDVAAYCGVPTEEVLGWIDSGMLPATYLPYGRYRVDAGDFLAFVQKFDVAF